MPVALAALAARLGLPSAASFAAKHWRPLALLGLFGALSLALLFARADAQHWRKVADKRAETIKENADAYAQAQRDAATKAAGERALHETETTDLAKRIDDANHRAQAAARDAAAAYAAAHRVRSCPAPGASGGTVAAAVPDGPASDPGAGPAADMVAVSRADFDQLTSAAVRAAIARQWAEELIAKGYAVPAEPNRGE